MTGWCTKGDSKGRSGGCWPWTRRV